MPSEVATTLQAALAELASGELEAAVADMITRFLVAA